MQAPITLSEQSRNLPDFPASCSIPADRSVTISVAYEMQILGARRRLPLPRRAQRDAWEGRRHAQAAQRPSMARGGQLEDRVAGRSIRAQRRRRVAPASTVFLSSAIVRLKTFASPVPAE